MRIAFLTNKDPSLPQVDNDGGGVTPRYYALELGKKGHKIDIFTPRILPSETWNNYLKIKCREQKSGKINLAKNVRVIRQPIKTVKGRKFLTPETKDLAGIIDSFLFAEALEEKDLYDYDIVSFFHPLTAYGVINKELVEMSKSVLFPMLLSDNYFKYQSLSQVYCDLEKSVLKDVGYIFSSSEDEKNTIIKKGIPSKKIKVIHRGFDESIFYPKVRGRVKSKERIMIACVGAIRPQKEQEKLVDVVRLLKQEGLETNIIIVGENYKFYKNEHEIYYNKLINLISRSHLERNFEFAGSTSLIGVARILRDVDMAVFPSASESYGKSVLESIATGTPTIICDDVPAYNEFAEPDKNVLSVRRTPREFADAIKKLVNDSLLYYHLSSEGIKTTKNFTWEKVTKNLEDFYINIRYKSNFGAY